MLLDTKYSSIFIPGKHIFEVIGDKLYLPRFNGVLSVWFHVNVESGDNFGGDVVGRGGGISSSTTSESCLSIFDSKTAESSCSWLVAELSRFPSDGKFWLKIKYLAL